MIKKGKSQKGLTLIELIVTIAIIGTLTIIALPRFVVMYKRAQWDADATILRGIANAAEIYVVQNNNFVNPINTKQLQAENLIDDPIALRYPNIVYGKDEGKSSLNIEMDISTGKAKMDDNTIEEILGERP